jgi:hypothetical protein
MEKPFPDHRTTHLSITERETGVRCFRRYSFFNGAGFAFMADTTVTLLALHFGATNTQLGYLASAIFISGLVLPFVPTLFGGMSVVRVFHYTWLMRGFVCFLYLLTPVVPGGWAIALILTVYTVFCIVRVIGASLSQAIQHTLTTSDNTGEFVAQLSLGFNVSTLIAKIISAGILRLHLFGEVAGLLALQLLGIGSNTMAAGNLRKIPGREVIERRPGQSILTTFIDKIRQRETALVLVLNWSSLCVGILFGFTIPFLRRVIGMSDSMIFVYSIAGTLAAITAAIVIKPFADRVGSKPLLIVCNAVVAGFACLWAFIPPSLNQLLYVGIGFVSGIFLGIAGLLTGRLMIRSIPENDKVGYTSVYSFFSALIALGAGFVAGLLADAGAHAQAPMLHQYSFPFLAAAAVALCSGILCLYLRDSGSMSLREATAILFSTKNLRAFLDIYQLGTTKDPVKRQSVIVSLEHSDTALATSEIGNWLKNPLPMEKERALRALFSRPRRELHRDILEEAQDPFSCNREHAIFALGAYPGEASEKVLLACMGDPNPLVQSVAAKSLARVGNTSLLGRIIDLAHDPAQSPECRLNYLIALLIMDRHAALLKELFTFVAPQHGPRFGQAAFSVCANRLNMTPTLASFYHRENMSAGKGFRDLVAETKEIAAFLENSAMLLRNYRQAKFVDIWQWCQGLLDGRPVGEPLDNLVTAVRASDRSMVDKTNTMAAVYFTFQILRK